MAFVRRTTQEMRSHLMRSDSESSEEESSDEESSYEESSEDGIFSLRAILLDEEGVFNEPVWLLLKNMMEAERHRKRSSSS